MRFFNFSIVGMKWDLSISGFALLTMGCANTRRENKRRHLTCTKTHSGDTLIEFETMLTGQPLHPRSLINTQVVNYNFHDAAQQLIEVL